jgi:diaminopimelate epimerase
MRFWKYESIGNDFVLLETQDAEDQDLSKLSEALCDRHFGVGSDGLLIVDPSANPVSMRMFNPDGTEDFCGNGLRCAALHIKFEHSAAESLVLLHGGQSIPIQFAAGDWIDVTLPQASFDPVQVPLAPGVGEVFERSLAVDGHSLTLSSLTTGSTHTVIFKDSAVTEEEFQSVSPKLEMHEWFPNRTSVIWAWQTGAKALSIRIWERGVGETLGCGTGSAAVAACWFRKHSGSFAVEIRNPGGETVASKGLKGSIIMSARARLVYKGVLNKGLTLSIA